MNRLYLLFHRCSKREKGLLLATLLVAVLWGFSHYAKKAGSVDEARVRLSGDRQEQLHWLGMRESIHADTRELLERMDRQKMLNAEGLAAWVENTVRRSNVSFNVIPGESVQRQGLYRHQLRLSLERMTLERLIQLVLEIDRNSPYILLEEISIDPFPRTPDLLNVRLRIASQETVLTKTP